MKSWPLQDAKAKLSEVVKKALSLGPQEITLRGVPAVIVISKDEFEALSRKRKKPSLIQFIRNSPLAGIKIKIERDHSPARDIDFSE